MDVLDTNNMKGHYLVMDNAPIHTPLKARELVESRGYKCLYLPLNFYFLDLVPNGTRPPSNKLGAKIHHIKATGAKLIDKNYL
jgi:hypothetical protein